MSCKVIYNDWAEATISSVSPATAQSYSLPDTIRNGAKAKSSKYGMFDGGYLRAGEKYSFLSNNATVPGFISTTRAGDDGVFSSPTPKLSITLSGAISTSGLTLYFDRDNNIYPTSITIRWTLSDSTMTSQTFAVTSNPFFCEKAVENYTAIRIEWKRGTPNQFARLYRIDFGEAIILEGDDIFDATLNESITFDETTINTSSISFVTERLNGLELQRKKGFDIYHNDDYIASHKVNTITTDGKLTTVEGRCPLNDLIYGYIPASVVGSWHGGALLSNILYECGISVECSDNSILLTQLFGKFTERVSKRTALTHLAFAVGCYVDTTETGKIILRDVSTLLGQSSAVSTIPETSVFEGAKTVENTEYKYFKMTVVNQAGETVTFSLSNPNATGTAEKEINCCFYPSSVMALLNKFAPYYFSPLFYKAKNVRADEYRHIGEKVIINGYTGIEMKRKIYLSSDKFIVEGEYIL